MQKHRVGKFCADADCVVREYKIWYLREAEPCNRIKRIQLDRFLCEQGLRNLRLRLVYAFVTRAQNKGYDRFLVNNVTPLFVQCSEALRLNGLTVPKDFPDRISLMEKEFATDGAVLRDLLTLKAKPRRLDDGEAVAWHNRVFPFVDKVLVWLESRWPE